MLSRSFHSGEAKQVTNKFAKKEIIGLLVDSPALALHQSIRGQLELSSTSEGLSTSAKSSETEQLRILSRSGLNGAHRSRGDTVRLSVLPPSIIQARSLTHSLTRPCPPPAHALQVRVEHRCHCSYPLDCTEL